MIPPGPSIEPVDPATQIARLERRLAREREARLAAEAIAEGGLLDLYRQQERLRLVETIARAANHGDDPAHAFAKALREICAYTGWPIGHVYMFADDDHSRLCSSGVWHGADDERVATFRRATEHATFVLGSGMPGQVLATGAAVWIEDVTVEADLPRAAAAAESGLHAAFAFPALIGDEVGAVVEFFQHSPVAPDPVLIETLNQIGSQLGRVVERYRSARRLRLHTEELEALYAEARAQKDAAEAASRAKSAFLAVTSHEIRTPLNAVLGLAEALRREPLTEAQHELNDGVLESGAMLLRLLNAVLDMSRIEADQATAQFEIFDLEHKLSSITSIWRPRAAETGVSLEFELAAEKRATTIRSDVGRIEQTLVNLLSNAIKFTPPGGCVRVWASLRDGRLRLEVVDDGPGVPEEDRDRIFKPFEQTDGGREAGGAGLGLAICSGNVRLLGGEIGVNRTRKGRNRFWFDCPVEMATAEVAPVRASAGDGRITGLRILAAEDNPANRRVLQVLLAPLGVDLSFAENGVEAVDAVLARAFDVILMDVNMPRMDGVEALREIRGSGAAAADTPVYMLTANAFSEDVERYLAAGADGVLTKPIDVPALYAVLAECGERVTGQGRDAA